jgi:hypothetical protein
MDGHSSVNIPDAEMMFLLVNPTDKTFDALSQSYVLSVISAPSCAQSPQVVCVWPR